MSFMVISWDTTIANGMIFHRNGDLTKHVGVFMGVEWNIQSTYINNMIWRLIPSPKGDRLFCWTSMTLAGLKLCFQLPVFPERLLRPEVNPRFTSTAYFQGQPERFLPNVVAIELLYNVIHT